MITHGENGAYLFFGSLERHVPVPQFAPSDRTDETGCGDQVMAVLCAEIARGKDLLQAADLAVRAGAIQYYRVGIQPVTRDELMAATGNFRKERG